MTVLFNFSQFVKVDLLCAALFVSKYYLGILFLTLSFLCFTCRLRGAKNTVVRDYVLPDYTHIKRGYVKVGRVLIC